MKENLFCDYVVTDFEDAKRAINSNTHYCISVTIHFRKIALFFFSEKLSGQEHKISNMTGLIF